MALCGSRTASGFSLLVLLLCSGCAVQSEQSTCSMDEVAQAAAEARRQGGARALNLVQVRKETDRVRSDLYSRASATQTETQEAEVLAAQMRSFMREPSNVGAALAAGLLAVHEALPLFTADPPQISKGFEQFGGSLLGAAALMIPAETMQTEAYAAFNETWSEVVASLPATVEGIAEDIESYKNDGDVQALVRVIGTAINELGSVATRLLPGPLDTQVIKFLGAVEDALEGFEGLIEAFTTGNTTGAIQTVYSGLRLAATELLPEEVVNEESFAAVVGALDSVFRDLSDTVLQYQQHLLESNVCWKDSMRRERVRPSHCPENYHWDGERWCYRGDSPALLETSVAWKRPSGAVPSRCDDESAFHMKRGAWCYKSCPYGTEVSGSRCRSACVGAYPVNSPLLCGKSPGTVAAAIQEMLVRTLTSTLSAAGLIAESGLAGGLEGTITALVDLGKGFAHPKCPILTGE